MGLDMWLKKCNKNIRGKPIFQVVGEWRKADAIHRWFVENVQNGIDDCGVYEVSKEQIERLLDLLGFVTKNKGIAENHLPISTNGLYFCYDGYGDYYWKCVQETIEILTKALKETNFDTEKIYYSSIW